MYWCSRHLEFIIVSTGPTDSQLIYVWSVRCVNIRVGIGLIITTVRGTPVARRPASLSVSVSVTVEELADHALLADLRTRTAVIITV